MPSNQTQRPKFYEEQYLGAADLTATVDYGRVQQARHSLGAHTWGIALGLQLKEKALPGGQVEAYIQPGYARDGFGRPVILLEPCKIPTEKFASYVYDAGIDEPNGRPIKIWLRYDETPTRGPRPGFEVCKPEDQYSRIHEAFKIEVGERSSHSDQHDAISVAGYSVDAKDTLQKLDPQTPPVELFDESVPFQSFPDTDANARWLICLGYVLWKPNPNANLPGNFVIKSDPQDLKKSRSLRRYIGVVAESVQAADSVIRLRDRLRDYSNVPSDDLVWVEGSLRVEGDARLFGGKLSFRHTDGQDFTVPLQMQRFDDPNGTHALQVAIGPDSQPNNRFGVGPLKTDGHVDEKLVILSGGNVGIGTTTPSYRLDVKSSNGIKLGLEGNGGGQLVIANNANDDSVYLEAFNAAGDDSAPDFLLTGRYAKNVPKLSVLADYTYISGNLGIGTATPANTEGWNKVLDILGNPHARLSVRTVAGIDSRLLAHDLGWWGSPAGMIIGTGSPHPLSFGTNATTRMIIDPTGNVGVGIPTPGFKLDVADRMRVRQGSGGTAGIWLYQTGPSSDRAFVGMAADDQVGFYGSTGAWWGLVMNTTSGNVGIGTGSIVPAIAPSRKLHVVGDRIRLEDSTRMKYVDLRVDGSAVDLHSETSNLYLRSSGNNNIIMNSFAGDGYVGIGTPAPSERLHVQGSLRVENNLYVKDQAYKWNGFTWTVLSDERLKQNINPLRDALSRLLQLHGVSFLWRSSEFTPQLTGPQMGLIAQEVEKVFPEWVTTTPDGHKALNLNGFEALMIEAIRELHNEVEKLKERLEQVSGDQSTYRSRKKKEPKEKST